MKPKAAHTSFKQGTAVLVHMRDGSAFEDRFKERKSQYVHFRQRGRIRKRDIRAISIKR